MTKIKLLALTKIELLVVISIIGMLAGLLIPTNMNRMTLLTKKTQADLENIRHLLFDMDFDKAIQTAEAIRQEAGREVAYFEIVYHLVEAERFDEAQKYISKIGSAFVRHERPPLSMVIQSRLAETLAAAGRFDEAEQALKWAAFQSQTAITVIIFLLNANRYDDAARLLDEYDIDSEFRRFFAVRFAKNGNYQKAIDIAKSVRFNDWRNETYQEIIREQLKQDQYQDAIQTFSNIELLRYKQQAVAIFVVYLLEKGRADEAKKLAERFKSPDQATAQNSDNDPFATTPDEWHEYTKNKRSGPFLSSDWQNTIADIFASFKKLDQADTKTLTLTESNDSISDARLKTFLADLESMSDVYDSNLKIRFGKDNELFHKVIKQLVKLNRTEEALPYVERLRKRCRSLRSQRLYQRYYFLGAIRINEMPLNHHFDF
ncbi:MAG: type II secretion system GspH family protein, partial [Planctomycetaceae bacterium]|nr:type II secretion system GspH family protein [Planctomycetaceae bacterium]